MIKNKQTVFKTAEEKKQITSKRAIITLRGDFSRKWKPENDDIFKALKENKC